MIDTTFNFQSETPGRDPDKYSPTLQEYHRILWSKILPNGKMFNLTKVSNCRLFHKSDLGEFTLSSDRAIPDYSSWRRLEHITSKVSAKKIDSFVKLTNTIGAIVVWPGNQVNGLPTINADRGFNRLISDRLDLTLECIRRYYLGETSPLFNTLSRYSDFFALFRDFKGYIDFFLLQDAVSEDYSSVILAHPLDNFDTPPVPRSVDEYVEYMRVATEFIKLRNKRISEHTNL